MLVKSVESTPDSMVILDQRNVVLVDGRWDISEDRIECFLLSFPDPIVVFPVRSVEAVQLNSFSCCVCSWSSRSSWFFSERNMWLRWIAVYPDTCSCSKVLVLKEPWDPVLWFVEVGGRLCDLLDVG